MSLHTLSWYTGVVTDIYENPCLFIYLFIFYCFLALNWLWQWFPANPLYRENSKHSLDSIITTTLWEPEIFVWRKKSRSFLADSLWQWFPFSFSLRWTGTAATRHNWTCGHSELWWSSRSNHAPPDRYQHSQSTSLTQSETIDQLNTTWLWCNPGHVT